MQIPAGKNTQSTSPLVNQLLTDRTLQFLKHLFGIPPQLLGNRHRYPQIRLQLLNHPYLRHNPLFSFPLGHTPPLPALLPQFYPLLLCLLTINSSRIHEPQMIPQLFLTRVVHRFVLRLL